VSRDLYLLDSRGSSRFWGLKVQATKRYQTSFTLRAAYQWSRATNDGDDYRIERSLPLDPGRPDLEWGRSAFDVPHSFVASGAWDAPLGLRLSAMVRARSGQTLDPRVEADLDGDLKLRERGFASGRILERNSFRAGSVASVDVAFGKTWELSEARRLALALDVFNLTNRLNPLQVLETYGASEAPLPSFGQVVQAASPRQFQLSVRFLF
jgi:outer membrane receptor protein involved in Fe transport